MACGWWCSPWSTWVGDDAAGVSARAWPRDRRAAGADRLADGPGPRHQPGLRESRHECDRRAGRNRPGAGRRRRLVVAGPARAAARACAAEAARRAGEAGSARASRGRETRARRGWPSGTDSRGSPAGLGRRQGRNRRRCRDGGRRARVRAHLSGEPVVPDQPALGRRDAEDGAGRHGRAARLQHDGARAGNHRARHGLGPGRAPVRRDPPHAAAPSHALGRPHRPAAVDRRPLGLARRHQSGPERPRRLDLVRRLPDRIRTRGRLRGVAGAARRHDADLAAGRARRRRGRRRAGAEGARAVSVAIRARVAAAAFLFGLALSGCDSLPGRPTMADREVPPTQVMAFDALYRKSCAGCHGADGRLGAARPLNDPVYLALAPADRLRTIVVEGMPGTSMPAFAKSAGGDLTNAQIDVLVKGMLTRWARPDALKGVTLPPYDEQARKAGPAEQERGAAVYASACARCHGPDGKGGPTAGSIVDPSFLALVSDQSLRTTVIAGRPDLGKPDWRDDVPGRPLTTEQISDVVAWLAGHRQPVPGRESLDGDRGRPRP